MRRLVWSGGANIAPGQVDDRRFGRLPCDAGAFQLLFGERVSREPLAKCVPDKIERFVRN